MKLPPPVLTRAIAPGFCYAISKPDRRCSSHFFFPPPFARPACSNNENFGRGRLLCSAPDAFAGMVAPMGGGRRWRVENRNPFAASGEQILRPILFPHFERAVYYTNYLRKRRLTCMEESFSVSNFVSGQARSCRACSGPFVIACALGAGLRGPACPAALHSGPRDLSAIPGC